MGTLRNITAVVITAPDGDPSARSQPRPRRRDGAGSGQLPASFAAPRTRGRAVCRGVPAGVRLAGETCACAAPWPARPRALPPRNRLAAERNAASPPLPPRSRLPQHHAAAVLPRNAAVGALDLGAGSARRDGSLLRAGDRRFAAQLRGASRGGISQRARGVAVRRAAPLRRRSERSDS